MMASSSSSLLLLLLAGITTLFLTNDMSNTSRVRLSFLSSANNNKIFAAANEILDELDRPGANRKVDIHKDNDDSSDDDDDSSDDDEGGENNEVGDRVQPPRQREDNLLHDSSDDDDDSSDDDDDEDSRHTCLKHYPDGSCHIYSNVQHFTNYFGQLEFKWASCNDPHGEAGPDFQRVDVEESLYQKVIFDENLVTQDKCLRLDNTL